MHKLSLFLLSALPLLAVVVNAKQKQLLSQPNSVPLKSKGTFNKDEDIKQSNDFIDKVLEKYIQVGGDELDPYHVKDEFFKISQSNMVTVKMFEGVITGFKSIYQTRDPTVVDRDGRMHIIAELRMDEMYVQSQATVRNEYSSLTFNASGRVESLDVEVEFSYDSFGNNGELHGFRVNHEISLKIEITEEAKMKCVYTEDVVDEIKRHMIDIFEKDVRHFLETIIEQDIDFSSINNGLNPFNQGGEVKRAVEFVERFVKDFTKISQTKYNPYPLKDENFVVFHPIEIGIKLYQGLISGFKTIHRSRDPTVNEENGKLHVFVDLQLDDMDIEYKASAESDDSRLSFRASGRFESVNVEMEFSFDRWDNKAILHGFKLKHKSELHLVLSAKSKLVCLYDEDLVEDMKRKIAAIFSNVVGRFLEDVIGTDIRMKLDEFKYPLEIIPSESRLQFPSNLEYVQYIPV